jgi:hypothetical protein
MGTLGRAVPLGARGAAGLEDEVEGRRLRGEDRALMQDDEAAIEELAQLDAAAGVGAVVRAGRQLDPAGPEADGVVTGDLARVAAAEDEGKIARGDAPGGRRVAREPREAWVQVIEEFGQKGIGPLGSGRGCTTLPTTYDGRQAVPCEHEKAPAVLITVVQLLTAYHSR